jgi:hypothetical protein
MPGVPPSPGFIRPDPKPHPDLPNLKKSGTQTLNDGREFRYSTITDYVDHLIAAGLVKDIPDLIANHSHLIAEIFFRWISTGQLGCIFALKLAQSPRENRWLPIVIPEALKEGKSLGAFLNANLDAAAESHEAAAIIMPDVRTERDVVALVNALCSDPSGRWYWTNDGVSPDPDGAVRLIGLRWVLKSNESVNYVLGFAAIKSMPFTRQSPFAAIFLRIKDHKMTKVEREDGRIKVHLADLDSRLESQELHDEYLLLTKPYRANRVEPQFLPVARAKVTFAVSPEAAEALCPPRKVEIEAEAEAH